MSSAELTGGLLVDDSAISLAIQLEARGHRLSSDRGVLKVSNGARLTPEDIAAIRRLRHHLIAIAVYPEMGATWVTTESDAHDSSTALNTAAIRVISKTATSLTSKLEKKTTSPRKSRKILANVFAWDQTAR